MVTGKSRHNPRVLELDSERALRKEMNALGCHTAGIDIMAAKGRFHLTRVDAISYGTANLVKQAFLSEGGDVAMSQKAYSGGDGLSDALLMGTWAQYQGALHRLGAQPVGEAQALADAVVGVLENYRRHHPEPMRIGETTFDWGTKTYVMGIINVTPDSFSGDGLAPDVDAALNQARAFVDAGVDILDIGGESTRPGGEPISADVELDRVLPSLRTIAGTVEVPISIDTYKAEVAAAALDAGAHIVNDVWGFRMDPDVATLVAERGVPTIVMHNRSRPKNAVQEERLGGYYVGIEYEDLMGDILRELRESIEIGIAAGVPAEQIMVDPGIGFGKTVKQNTTILGRLGELRSLGRPILVGTSRKSFIGHILDAQVEERLLGTLATIAIAIDRGADIVRVHDVAAVADVVRVTDAIVRR